MGWNVPRYPLEALVAHCGLSENQLRLTVRASTSRWKDAKAKGITERTADLWANRAGYHPSEVWPELTDALIAEHEAQEEARAEAKRRAARESARRRYQDPERREVLKARRRKQYEESTEYEKAAARRRYAANPEREMERRRAYYEANKERVLASQRAYRERKRVAS